MKAVRGTRFAVGGKRGNPRSGHLGSGQVKGWGLGRRQAVSVISLIDFDEKGNPILPTIVLHPDMMKRIEGKLAEWESDPELQARRKNILAKKKEEWRDRESNRKLVG